MRPRQARRRARRPSITRRFWELLVDADSPVSLPGRWLLMLFFVACGIFWVVAAFDVALSVFPGLWSLAAKASGGPKLPEWVPFILLVVLLWVGWRIFQFADRFIEPYTSGSKPVQLGPPPDDDPLHVQQRTLQAQREARLLRRR